MTFGFQAAEKLGMIQKVSLNWLLSDTYEKFYNGSDYIINSN